MDQIITALDDIDAALKQLRDYFVLLGKTFAEEENKARRRRRFVRVVEVSLEERVRAKLTEDGRSVQAVGKEIGVSRSALYRILNGQEPAAGVGKKIERWLES